VSFLFSLKSKYWVNEQRYYFHILQIRNVVYLQ
jgi:hypothetical protein